MKYTRFAFVTRWFFCFRIKNTKRENWNSKKKPNIKKKRGNVFACCNCDITSRQMESSLLWYFEFEIEKKKNEKWEIEKWKRKKKGNSRTQFNSFASFFLSQHFNSLLSIANYEIDSTDFICCLVVIMCLFSLLTSALSS